MRIAKGTIIGVIAGAAVGLIATAIVLRESFADDFQYVLLSLVPSMIIGAIVGGYYGSKWERLKKRNPTGTGAIVFTWSVVAFLLDGVSCYFLYMLEHNVPPFHVPPF